MGAASAQKHRSQKHASQTISNCFGRSRKKAQHVAIDSAGSHNSRAERQEDFAPAGPGAANDFNHHYWDAQEIRHGDTRAVVKAIHSIELPERFKDLSAGALVKVYRRARERLASGIRSLDRFDRKMG